MIYYFLRAVAFMSICVFSISVHAQENRYSWDFFIDPDFFSSNIKKVTILPVIDDRKNKDIESKLDFYIDFKYMLRAQSSGELITIKDYEVSNADTYGQHQTVSINDLQAPTSEWIKKLGDDNSRFNMIFLFADARSIATFGSHGTAKVQAFLFDKLKGKLIWRNSFESDEELSGVVGLLVPEYHTVVGAIIKATKELFHGFPKKGMTYKSFSTSWSRE